MSVRIGFLIICSEVHIHELQLSEILSIRPNTILLQLIGTLSKVIYNLICLFDVLRIVQELATHYVI